ncbi:MAG TPA: HD domain-containing phosphohydrolase [Abditibacterium sp.]
MSLVDNSIDCAQKPIPTTAQRSAEIAVSQNGSHFAASAADKAPIILFEWELTPEERAGDENETAKNGDEDNAIRWTGSLESHLGLATGEIAPTLEAWCSVLHPESCERVLTAIENHLSNAEPFFENCRAQRSDKTWLGFVFSGVATRDAKGNPWKFTGTLSNFVDLDKNGNLVSTASKREQQEKARAESLLRTAAYLNAQLDLKTVCEAICEEAARILGAPSAVMLFDKGRDAFVPTALRDMPHDYGRLYIPTMRSIYNRHVAEMGTLFLFTDAQTTPELPNHELYKQVDMRTIGIASLIREGEVLGLLKVYSFVEPRTFDANELALLQGLADLGAQAISNARFYAASQRRLSNLQALRQIDMAILGSSEVNVALCVVVDQIISQLGIDAASVLLLNSHSRSLRYATGRGFRTNSPRRFDWRLGEGLAGRAALERRLIYVPDLSMPTDIVVGGDVESRPALANSILEDVSRRAVESRGKEANAMSPGASAAGDQFSRRSGILNGEGFVSYYAVPLVAGGQVQGVLEVWSRSPLQLDAEETEFLETLAGQAAIAVDNAQLFRDVQRFNDELIMAYDSTLEGWSGALDLRDKETEGHTQRVTEETMRLAAFMGLDDAQLVQIRRGALLHDIGKMGIPDAILLKPGPLSDEEWVVMKKHPVYALELLSRIEYLRPALEIPYSHHEKWDGSGYPRGLEGEQIPLAARIFAIIDVWDALCSDRPYRKGWPLQRVLEHIKEGAGTHFDPQIVEVFLRMQSFSADETPPIEEPEMLPVALPTLAPNFIPVLAPPPRETPRENRLAAFWRRLSGRKSSP